MPTVLSGPSRVERLALLAGALALPLAGVLALALPEPPPTKGGGWQAPGAPELLVFLAGALLVVATARTVARGWRARRWAPADGEVLEVRPGGGPYLFVRYRYAVDGTPHEVGAVRYGLPKSPPFRAGDAVRVLYDPVAPATSEVHPAVSPVAATALGLGLVVLTLGAFSMS